MPPILHFWERFTKKKTPVQRKGLPTPSFLMKKKCTGSQFIYVRPLHLHFWGRFTNPLVNRPQKCKCNLQQHLVYLHKFMGGLTNPCKKCNL